MKSIPAVILFAVFNAACSTKKKDNVEYFTGTIEYAYTYTSDSLNTDSLIRVRPSKGIFRYDANDYQSRFIGADTFTYYYSGKLNKCLSEAGTTRQYECEDYAVETDSFVSAKEYATEEKVFNHPCRILEIQKGTSWVKYYYTTDYQIAPTTYGKHKAYNWDVYGRMAKGGLILKLEHRFKKFTMKGEVQRLDISDDSNFKALEAPKDIFVKNCK